MACSIIRNSATNELESVLAPNGKESILFDSILKLQPDAEQALRMWAQAYTPSFKTVYGDWEKGESSLKLDANQEPLLSGINLPAFKNLKEGAYKPKDKLLEVIQDQKNSVGLGILGSLLESLRSRLNVDYQLITADEARELTKNTNSPWKGEPAFYLGNKVYMLADRASTENALHEYSHPLLRAIAADNPVLFNNLYNKLATTPEGNSIIADVKKLYPEYDENSNMFKEEVLVRATTLQAQMKLNQEQPSKGFLDFIKTLLLGIKQLFRKVFGSNIKVDKLDVNTTLQDLADMLLTDKFDLSTAIATEEDVVAYVRDLSQYIESLQKVDQSSLVGVMDRFYDVITNHIRRLKSSKNYEEARKYLVEESGRGQLEALRDTLAIDKELDKLNDEVEINRRRSNALVLSLLRFSKLSDDVRDQIDELAKDGTNSKETIGKIFYYDILVRNWKQFIDETQDRLSDGGLNMTSELGKVISSTLANFEQTERKIAKVYADNMDSVIYDSLKPLAENIDKIYKDRLEKLSKDPNAKKEMDAVQKEWDKLKLTKEKVNKMLKGELGDTNAFSVYLEAYTASPDPIVGGFAMFLKNIYNSVDAEVQRQSVQFQKELDPALKEAGYSNVNFTELMKKLVFLDKIGVINPETGKVEVKEVITFLNKYKDYTVEVKQLREKRDMASAEGDEAAALQYDKELRAHLRDYFHQEYTPEYYQKEKIYDSELGKIAYDRKQQVLLDIKELDAQDFDDTLSDEIAEQKRLLWRKYAQLASLSDEEGNPKTGDELKIAEIERDYRKNSRKFFESKEIQGLFEFNLRQFEQSLYDKGLEPESDEFKAEKAKWLAQNTRIKYTDAFYEERAVILNKIAEIMETLPDKVKNDLDIAKYMEQILDISVGYRDEEGQIIGTDISETKSKKIKVLQEKMNELREAFAGYTGLTSDEFDELSALFAKVSAKQKLSDTERTRMDELLDRKNKLGIGKHAKTDLQKLFAKLGKLQTREATDYYLDIVNNWMEKLGVNQTVYTNENVNDLLDPAVVEELKDKDPSFAKWFDENHIKKEFYNVKEKRKEYAYQRLFIWNKTRPSNPDHYERTTLSNGEVVDGVPASNFFYRAVKNEYRTKRVVGETVDNKGNWLPKDTADGKYANPAYEALRKNDPKAFKVLEIMTKYHLKFQDSAARDSRLYLQVPRFQKNRLELLKDTSINKEVGKVKEWIKEAKSKFFTEQDDFEDGLNFNPNQLVSVDMFDEEIKKIPVQGLYNIDADRVSMNLPHSMLRYLHSAVKQKKLIKINPVAQALKKVVNNEDNAIKDMNKYKKWQYKIMGKLENTALTKAKDSNRAKAINNLYEREFEGVRAKGLFSDSTPFNKILNFVMKQSAFGFFALNIPSAIKNRMGAIVQMNIESLGSKYINPLSFVKGKPYGYKMMAAISSEVYKTGPKSLLGQMIDIFDPAQGRFKEKLGEGFGRSGISDIVDLKVLMAPRKWLELEATVEFFAGMMVHAKVPQTINGKTTTINYIDAFELRDGQIELKPGIDKEYAPGGSKFNEMKNKIHEVNNRLQGTYSELDQPELNRYAIGKLVLFLRKFFTSMFMERVGKKRYNAALGTMSEGRWRSIGHFMNRFAKSIATGSNQLKYMTDEERNNFVKSVSEIMTVFIAFPILLGMMGYHDDDEDRFAKMKERSGNLFEDDFNLGGFLVNHLVALTLQTQNETNQFLKPSEYTKTFTSWSSLTNSFNVQSNLLRDFSKYAMDKDDAYYKKDVGPYSWQEEGSAKYLNDIGKLFGLTGNQVDPVKAVKAAEYSQRR
jgi:hypothetical protein